MSITKEQIDLWRQTPSEHQRLEFKAATKQFDNKKLYQYCVSLANEGGGHLILGIADTPPHPVLGTSAFNDLIVMTEKLFQALGFRVDIEEVFHKDGRVLVFHIPSRPRGTAYHFEGQYLMRSGQQLRPMSEDQLRKIFAEGYPDWLSEISRKKLDEQQIIDLLDTQSFFELLKRPFPADRNGVLDRLIQERLIDKEADGFAINRLGALLLARRLKDFPDIERKAPRVIVYKGDSKIETKIDQIGTKGYAVGFQGLIEFIMGQLPQNEIIKDALRKQVKLVPEIVIRELVANALIHQEFNVTGTSIMIEIYDNRMEISNPGEPIVPVERFIDGYQSRNERLADFMRRLGICEEKSSGIDKVIQAAEFFQLPAPDFKKGFKRTVVIIYGPKDFDDMNRSDRIRACFQHCALKWVMSEQMTNQTLRERFHLSESKNAVISQVIAATVQAELIKIDQRVGGSRKFARYVPFWA